MYNTDDTNLTFAEDTTRSRGAFSFQGFSRSPSSRHTRFWEIDAIRGVAIVMMVIYHLVYDLYYFAISNAIFEHRFWFYFQRTTASTFIVLVGVSLALRYQQTAARNSHVPFLPFLRRGLTVLGWGLIITAVTWFALGPRLAIRFGILHFIGLATIAAYPFLSRRWPNLVLGALLLAAGKALQTQTFDLPWLLWLGFEPANHAYVDFFPFIKWFGVVLLGVFTGRLVYDERGRRFGVPDLSAWPPVQILQNMGHRSLPIYLLHQPLLLLAFFLLFWLMSFRN